MKDASKIPTFAEPWFLTFNADVEFRAVMTPDDLKTSFIFSIDFCKHFFKSIDWLILVDMALTA